MWTQPTVEEFKEFFIRDFNFAPADDPNNLDYVIDSDITKAITAAMIHFPTDLFGSDDNNTYAFMYLAGFYLVSAIQVSSKGLSSQSKFPISGNSVGSVSINFSIPERYSKDPYLSSLTTNGYGMMYLSLIIPLLVGNVGIALGTTLPV